MTTGICQSSQKKLTFCPMSNHWCITFERRAYQYKVELLIVLQVSGQLSKSKNQICDNQIQHYSPRDGRLAPSNSSQVSLSTDCSELVRENVTIMFPKVTPVFSHFSKTPTWLVIFLDFSQPTIQHFCSLKTTQANYRLGTARNQYTIND